MFEGLLQSFDELSIESKRKEIKDELRYLTMIFEKICESKNINYRKILDERVVNLINNYESEDEYLNSMFTYIEALKEMLGSYIEND